MIIIFGDIFLIFAMIFSITQSVLPLWGYWRKNPYLLALARPSAWAQCIMVVAAYLLLTVAFATNDFSMAYVASNSHPSLPLLYRITAVWGAHEGSILLWVLVLSFWTVIFSFSNHAKKLVPLSVAILGLISFCFLCFLLFTSNPFLPALDSQGGLDLNPLLQDPGFVIHPPILYTGYVGFSVAFALTQAALLTGQLNLDWAKITRQYTIAAWCFLTLGITLGSWWAYRVLGWGGFWFWDPVENASLLPWLSGTALIHVLILVEKKQTAVAWAALLAIITFALSVLGTFLVRSGVLVSAHTFASDPKRGVFLLLLLTALTTLALIVYVTRLPHSSTKPSSIFHWLSREVGLLLNSTLLFVAMLTILLGTLYPLIIDGLHLGAISVGAPYFNMVMTPLVFIVMVFMGLVPLCRWGNQTGKNLWREVWKKIIISLISAPILLWIFVGEIDITVCLCLSLSIWIVQSIVETFRTLPGMSLAHLGFAVLVIGIMLSSVLAEEREVRVKPGHMTQVGPYQFFFVTAEGADGSNYRGIRATFEVIKNNRHIVNMFPGKRIYTVRNMVMTKVDIHPGIFRDLYIALGEPLNDDFWSVRFYYKPFIRWTWFGGVLMMIGGIVAIIQRRREKIR